jgi:cellulose synthase/poly-beta-1,6-N-acetylglucosamine synthase-like glycosyltransferase
MQLLAKGKESNMVLFSKDEALPHIVLITAAYNEEHVIQQKLDNFLALDYPKSKMSVFIGSDNSTDSTNSICAEFSKKYDWINFINFTQRGGKAGVLNALLENHIDASQFEVAIMSDANVILKDDAVFEMVKHFKNKAIGVVAANIVNTDSKYNEVDQQERFYISKENELKSNEGIVFGATVGAFGACYAIRMNKIESIPPNFLMEDFFLSMKVLEAKMIAITELKSIAYEDLPGQIEEEFKRKRRISAGNFQNLNVFKHLLFQQPFGVAFTFFSHKIIRWFGPFLLFTILSSLTFLCVLAPLKQLYQFIFVLTNVALFGALLDYVLMNLNIHVNLLRLIRYFLLMNFALFLGFLDYIKGVQTNIWKPTERNE